VGCSLGSVCVRNYHRRPRAAFLFPISNLALSKCHSNLSPFFLKTLELAFCADAKISKLLPFDYMLLERMTARDLLSQELRIEPALIDSAFCATATFWTEY
jgi:hypothetical protein